MHVDSVILGNISVRREYTQADEQQFIQALQILGDNRFDFFPNTKGGQSNRELIDEFFQTHRDVAVNVQNIFRAVEERKPEFVSLTPAQHDWYKAAQANVDLADQIAIYVSGTSGRPGALIKDGDQLFENLLHLFNELQSRRESVSAQAIANAENRIANRPGPKLQYVAQPRKPMGTITEAARNDDGTNPFSTQGLTKQPDGSYGKSPAQYKAEALAAHEAANPQPTVREKLSAEEETWQKMTQELLRWGTHAQQAAIKQVYDQNLGNSWREVFKACDRVVKMYQRAAAVSGWGGR